MGSSSLTQTPCVGAQCLSHWTTREVPNNFDLKHQRLKKTTNMSSSPKNHESFPRKEESSLSCSVPSTQAAAVRGSAVHRCSRTRKPAKPPLGCPPGSPLPPPCSPCPRSREDAGSSGSACSLQEYEHPERRGRNCFRLKEMK